MDVMNDIYCPQEVGNIGTQTNLETICRANIFFFS